jgi:DNA invertase Pin-like site-specific DNA recombinase
MHQSRTSRNGRTEVQVLFDFLQPGDMLMVTRIDRLARSVRGLQDIVHELRAKGVTLKGVHPAPLRKFTLNRVQFEIRRM